MNNQILKSAKALNKEMITWFEILHQMPELAMQEYKTSQFIATKLNEFGYEVVEGIGNTGIVASLHYGTGTKSIGLRADFDALPIQEDNDFQYKSRNEGIAHLCGHDAHSVMLLGAAKYFAKTKNFNGTIHFIFQPGEETMQGGQAMITDGLFDLFEMNAVYALHNMPGIEWGKFFFRENEMMAAVDNWEIEITGKGSHSSMPELGIDPIVCGASIVMALQSIVSLNISSWENSVVAVSVFQAGNAQNAIAQNAIIKLSIRNMKPEIRVKVLNKVRTITFNQAKSFGCNAEIREGAAGAVLINTPDNTRWAKKVAADTFGADQALYGQPYMGSEDFAFMLQKKNGTYAIMGAGDVPMVHNPQYFFDTDLLPRGTAYWIALVEDYLK